MIKRSRKSKDRDGHCLSTLLSNSLVTNEHPENRTSLVNMLVNVERTL